eukprot:jgi/Astpho2/6491/Aster-06953
MARVLDAVSGLPAPCSGCLTAAPDRIAADAPMGSEQAPIHSAPRSRKFLFVITGFGEFHKVPPGTNPSEILATALEREWPKLLAHRAVLHSCTVLTVAAEAVKAWLADIAQQLQGERDVILLHFGLDNEATCIKLEKQAKNEATFRVPDQAGWQPTSQTIIDRLGIDSRSRTDLPIDVCCDALKLEGYRCQQSLDPGLFVCNFIYYNSMALARQNWQEGWHSLFVHVPPVSVVDTEDQFQFGLALVREIVSQCF